MGTKKGHAAFFPPPQFTTEIRVEQIHDLHSWYISVLEIKVSKLLKELKEIGAMNCATPFEARPVI